MKRKYVFVFSICFVFLFQTLVLALIPSPPVNQNMGMYDTLFINVNESKCRSCHATGVPDTHHNLVATGAYSCANCHPVLPDGSGITIVRDCIQCHNNTFNGMTIPRPHHESKTALAGHCKDCHGSLVDSFDDGHHIPSSPPSSMTPNATYKVINETNGKKWGGCESCHDQDLTAIPFIASNNNTHHSLGNLSGFQNGDNTRCEMCHDTHNGSYGVNTIRACEKCHGYNSLHNIQWDMSNTVTQPGYGHLGPDDCQGCHASYVAGSLAPGADIIMPTINNISSNNVLEGSSKMLTIYGDNFVTTVDNVTRSSVVMITGGISDITISPTNISPNEIIVILPPLNKGLYGIHVHKDGNAESNTKPIVSAPPVIINSARKIDSTLVTINGSGFGTYESAYEGFVNVTINVGDTVRPLQILDWSDTDINVTSSDDIIGYIATVNSIYGANSSQITSS
ncbi:MAG: IPT/TIG domain-containing protein [Candidatus Methanoperedens sp.]|nr:IPT/TIG domain-containing protein [Candidatus Methanoperedens sp.]